MKLKEFFETTQRDASALGNTSFRWDWQKEFVKTPHFIMNKCIEMIENRPNISSGLRQHVRFLLSDIKFTSDDEKSVHFMNEWFKARPGLNDEIFKFTSMWAGIGTAYMEPTYLQFKNGKKVLDNLFCVPDSSIMYRNLDPKDDSEYWLMQVPLIVREYNGKTPKYRPIYYIKGSVFFKQLIWCIAYPKEKYKCETFGISRTPFYGAGLLYSAVDNGDVEEEILKNWALQAKFRSIGKKIIGFYNSNQEPVSPQELDQIKQDFMNLEEEDSLLTNKRFDQASLSFANEDNSMQEQIQFLRKDTGSSLVPNFMTATSQDSSMATAAESKIPFGLELKAEQFDLVKVLNRMIIDELRKSYSWLAKDLSFSLPLPDLYNRMDTFNVTKELFNLQAATMNELRVAAGYHPIQNGDVWGTMPPLDKATIRINPNQQQVKDAKDTQKQVMTEVFDNTKSFKESVVYSPIVNKLQTPVVDYEAMAEDKLDKVRKKNFKEALKEMKII